MTGPRLDVRAEVIYPDPPVGDDGQPLARLEHPDRLAEDLDAVGEAAVLQAIEAVSARGDRRVWLHSEWLRDRAAVEALAGQLCRPLVTVQSDVRGQDFGRVLEWAERIAAVVVLRDAPATGATIVLVLG